MRYARNVNVNVNVTTCMDDMHESGRCSVQCHSQLQGQGTPKLIKFGAQTY